MYNAFLANTFKAKIFNLEKVHKLLKCIGIGLYKNQINENLFRNRDTAQPIKERLNAYLARVLNEENELQLDNGYTFQPYRFYIGAGNNSFIVRRLFKQRYWWWVGEKESFDDVNFIWTQWRKNTIIDMLPARVEDGPLPNTPSRKRRKKRMKPLPENSN